MTNIRKSEYIRLTKTILRKLFSLGCFGEGPVYINVLKSGISPQDLGKVEKVLEALVKQNICGKKKKERGWKYHLNKERLDKIEKIIK